MGVAARRVKSGLRPVQLVALGVFALALLPGVALTLLSPAAWPIPVAALVGVVVMVLTGARRARSEDDEVSVEAASGTEQLEDWLRQRHRT